LISGKKKQVQILSGCNFPGFYSPGSGKTDEEIETTIRQVIDKALVSEQVIDIFDAAGIKKPDISILSEEFLMELKGMEHKNVALEVLKKLLNDEIKSRAKKNLVKSRSFLEMLENSIKKYHNKILTAAEVIEERLACISSADSACQNYFKKTQICSFALDNTRCYSFGFHPDA